MLKQFQPVFDEKDAEAVAEVVRSGWVSEGPKTKEFETRLAEICGTKYCVATNNGTVALSLALMAVGAYGFMRVWVPNLTFVATANSAKMMGCHVRFTDVRKENLCMDFHGINAFDVDIIVPVHLNGRKSIDGEIGKQCKEAAIKTVVDAAQALGSLELEGADAYSMSFAPNKIVTTGQGGAVFTDNPILAENVRRLKDHGRTDKADYHPRIGFDFKFTDIQATLGLSQLDRLSDIIHKRKMMFKQYREELPQKVQLGTADDEMLWNQDIMVSNRQKVASRLLKLGIETRPYYRLLTRQPPYFEDTKYPVASEMSLKMLWLPSSNNLSEKEISFVCDSVKKCLEA